MPPRTEEQSIMKEEEGRTTDENVTSSGSAARSPRNYNANLISKLPRLMYGLVYKGGEGELSNVWYIPKEIHHRRVPSPEAISTQANRLARGTCSRWPSATSLLSLRYNVTALALEMESSPACTNPSQVWRLCFVSRASNATQTVEMFQ